MHRWFVFPHSFTDRLVSELLCEWGIRAGDHVLDPFVGAGTTLLAAAERGVAATGYDLSPLSVFVTRAKATRYQASDLQDAWRALRDSLAVWPQDSVRRDYPELIHKAFPQPVLSQLEAISAAICAIRDETSRAFFRLALLATLPRSSRMVAAGGWLKWQDRAVDPSRVASDFCRQVELMLGDVGRCAPHGAACSVEQADARFLPDADGQYAAVITSPPYPNRHDYTRVFAVELLFAFLDEAGNRALRAQSFHSHPEARPQRPDVSGYRPPEALADCVGLVRQRATDPRVPRMLEGYFQDLYLSLREMRRVSQPGARLALVVGNAQYHGVPVLVDELTAQIGESLGLELEAMLVARYRGNSAQQMGRFGRNPSRETVVVLRNP